jgi:hypothetical protein
VTWLAVFAALAVTDFFWALTVRKAADNAAFSAGLWAVPLFLGQAVGVIGYVHDWWLLVPGAAGTFVGTAAGVLWNKRVSAILHVFRTDRNHMDGLEMSSDILAARELRFPAQNYASAISQEISQQLDNPERRHEPDGICSPELPDPALVEDAPQKMERQSVLLEAHNVIHGARSRDYGAALDNHTATADMLSAYLRRKYGIAVSLTAEDVCLFNVLQKVARLANTPDHRDSLVDIAGYAGNVEMVQQERARRG